MRECELVDVGAGGIAADAVGREGHDHRAARGRRRAPEPAVVRAGQGGHQGLQAPRLPDPECGRRVIERRVSALEGADGTTA
jgi:hypothetical protein